MANIQQTTANIQHPKLVRLHVHEKWLLVVGCWWLVVTSPLALRAQAPPEIPPALQAQLQVQQPAVDVSPPEKISATAIFDPAIIRAGGKTFYRVNVDAAESSFALPEKIPAPTPLKFGVAAHGQIARLDGNKFHPLTTFVFEVQPTATGHFTIANFTVDVAGQPVAIPAASLDVLAENFEPPVVRRLGLETSATNLFVGQPFRVRVLLPVGPGNEIEALREVQFNGVSLMTDKTATRLAVEPVNYAGQLKPAFIYETVATPIATGPMDFSAQAFTAGREFGGPIAISGQVTIAGGAPKYDFLTSAPLKLNVRPLPDGELAGFTGTIGKFLADKPQLSTNRVRVGEPVKLKFGFHGEGNLTRFVPPEPPRARDWQIIAGKPGENSFTLIPQTDATTNTPAIPFSAFDPVTKTFYDLTIPALSVTVVGEGLPVEWRGYDESGKNSAPLKLSALATAYGKTATNLRPPQLCAGFVCLLLLPVLGLVALWRWDERRRFLEAHPEIVRRRQALRELRREKIKIQNAVAAGDAATFVSHAAAAMRIAVAPHFPADSRALVGGDVLAQLSDAERTGMAGETVRNIFAAADAKFSGTGVLPVALVSLMNWTGETPAPPTAAELLALKPDVEIVLEKLEEKL